MKEQLEDQGGGDLVGHVGNTHVEEGQLSFDDVSDEHLQLGLVVCSLHALLQLGHHSKHNQIRNSATKNQKQSAFVSFDQCCGSGSVCFWANSTKYEVRTRDTGFHKNKNNADQMCINVAKNKF
jgi:hypothetical protein